MGAVLSVVATLVVLVFFVTSGDSATLVLAMMSTGGNPNPGARVKLVWGVLVAAIATSLMLAGGLRAVQTATIIFALPFTAVVVLMAVSVVRAIAHDWREERRREQALRRRMRELVKEPGAGGQSPP
jgi:glycine betaine transporter